MRVCVRVLCACPIPIACCRPLLTIISGVLRDCSANDHQLFVGSFNVQRDVISWGLAAAPNLVNLGELGVRGTLSSDNGGPGPVLSFALVIEV